MALYETVFIARQDVSAKQVEDMAKAFGKVVNDNGGDVKRTEPWGLRTLAYKIKKNRKGHYTLLHLEAPAKAVAEMERNMRLNEDVLRFMTVSIEKLPEGPSAILKHSDDERGDDDRGGFGRERGEGFGRERGEGFSRDRGDRSEGASRDREERPKFSKEGAE